MVTHLERRTDTTRALGRSARRMFARHGFDAVSVDAIAAAAGVTRGAFYYHFASKEALFEAVFDEAQTTILTAVREAAAPVTDPVAQIIAGSEAFLAAASDRRYRRIVLVDAPAVLGQARYRELEEARFLGLMRTSLARLRPGAPPGEIAVVARTLLASLCALAGHAADHPGDLDVTYEVMRSLVRGGLATPPPA